MRNKFRNIAFVLTVILVIGGFAGCSSNSIAEEARELPTVKEEKNKAEDKAKFTNITPEEAKKRLDSGEEIVLLDVRTKEEYDAGHIKESVLIPVDVLQKEAENSLKDKNIAIFVYCRSGNRSVTAANILVELGYTNVYNLGGIRDWPYEVVK